MIRRFLHGLFVGHEWWMTGKFAEEIWTTGAVFWVELARCKCGAKRWMPSIRATRAHIESDAGELPGSQP